MGYNKIINLLGKLEKDDIPKFTTIKWIEIFDQSNGTYNPNKDIRFKTPQIRDDLCDFNDAYIVVTGNVTATNPDNDINVYDRKFSLKNSAPFFNCILKINNQLIEDAQDLDIVNPMYNLLYYSKNFRKTARSFWNYYPDKPNSSYTANTRAEEILRKGKFRSKTKFINTLPGVNDIANDDAETESGNLEIIAPLKNVSNFLFSLNFLMINTEIELILKRSQNCVLTQKVTREGDNLKLDEVPAINRPKDLKFNIIDCKLYVSVVTLQETYDNELLEELKNRIDINFEWKRY